MTVVVRTRRWFPCLVVAVFGLGCRGSNESAPRARAEDSPTPAPPPASAELEDDVVRYVNDSGYRRGILQRDLTNKDALYAKIRLARYSVGGANGWEHLPLKTWRTAPVTAEVAERIQRDQAIPSDLSFDGIATDPRTWPATEAEWAALGERVFFEYPFALSPPVGRALREGVDLGTYGMLQHDGDYVGLRVVETPNGARIGVTCAVCHASIGADGRPSAVRANRSYDFGRLRLAHGRTQLQGGVDVTGVEHLAELGPGRSDVQRDDVFNPYAFPDLGGIRDVPFLHHTASWRHTGTATMAIRVETVFTRGGKMGWRPPRALMWALASYFRALPPPPPVREPDALSARGKTVFEDADCDMCHVPPTFTAREPVALDEIGTDDAAGRSRARGTGTWRVPSLRGVGGNAPYLHHGAFPTLEAMFEPDRVGQEPGHEFGLDLSTEDRTALLAYLRTI